MGRLKPVAPQEKLEDGCIRFGQALASGDHDTGEPLELGHQEPGPLEGGGVEVGQAVQRHSLLQ